MKAWNVFPGDDPYEVGCILVFAETRNKARMIGLHGWPGLESDYIDFKAWRVPKFDKYAKKEEYFDTNEGLPEPFFIDEITLAQDESI